MSNGNFSGGFSLPSRSSDAHSSSHNSSRHRAGGPARHRPGPPPPPTHSSSRNGGSHIDSRKRPLSAFQRGRGSDYDSDSDNSGSDDDAFGGRGGGRGAGGRHKGHEAITGFDERGAVRAGEDREEKKGPLVIPRLKNRDWRGELRGKRGGDSLLPEEERRRRAAAAARQSGDANGEAKDGVDVVNSEGSMPSWGLTITKKRKLDGNGEDADDAKNAQRETETTTSASTSAADAASTAEESKTDDQLALEALLGGESSKKGPDLVITSTSTGNTYRPAAAERERQREGDAYRKAIASAPDVSTLDDYERVPVEDFGAALLRGMGWDGKSTKPKDVQRRQNLLGLGAKALQEAEELGGWDQKAGSRGGRGDKKKSANDYRREKERKEKERDDRYGGGYRRDRDREREREYRDRDRHRDRDRYRDYDRR